MLDDLRNIAFLKRPNYIGVGRSMMANQIEVQELTEDLRQDVLSYADPITNNLLIAFNEGDYEKLSRDFDEQMKTLFTQPVFEQTRQMIQAKIGKYQTREPDKVQKKGPYRVVVYRAVFEREPEVQVTISFMKYEDLNLVSGLWFNSPKLREE